MEILLISFLFLGAVFFFVKRFVNSFSASKRSSCPGCSGGCNVGQMDEKIEKATGSL